MTPLTNPNSGIPLHLTCNFIRVVLQLFIAFASSIQPYNVYKSIKPESIVPKKLMVYVPVFLPVSTGVAASSVSFGHECAAA